MNYGNVWTLVGSLIAYGFLMFALPDLCVGKYIKNASLLFRFFFYQCVGNLYITFSMLFLGYMHLFNRVTAVAIIFGLPVAYVCIRERRNIKNKWKSFSQTLGELLSGTYGGKLFSRNINDKIRAFKAEFREYVVKGNVTEILIFIGVMAWLIWFYGWYKFHNVGYAHTDEETHLYWIAELLEGNLFPVGMYPHGVHTLVALISVITGLTVTRVYLVFCIITVILVYSSAYLVFRKMFSHVYVALIGWVAVALLDVFHVTSYFRFQSSFPMEYGLVAAFGMVYAMFAYIHSKSKKQLVLFSLCITWSLMAHFYITILCAVLCVCFGLVYGIVLIKRKLLLSFLIGGLAGIILAVVPYGVGYVQGYPFERSIEWALGMTSTNQENAVKDESEFTEEELREDAEMELLRKELVDDIKEPWQEEIRERFATLEVYLTKNYALNREVSAGFLYAHMGMLVFSLCLLIFKKQKELGRRWMFFTVFWMAGAIMACAYYLKIPALIEVKRMATFLMFFTIPVFGLALEVLAEVMRRLKLNGITGVAIVVAMAEIVAILATDSLREERYYDITISEGDMLVSLDLVENKEDFTWTMVSPTNDLSVVRYDGYHYEILDLLNELDNGEKEIYIPTPEIYVLVEHKPISYKESKRKIDRSDIVTPLHSKDVSAKLALWDVDFETVVDELHGTDAPYYFQRDVVMSKMYYWMEGIKDVYASHVSEYYRDEQLVIYKIEQDPYFLLNLSVDYKSIAEKVR